MARLICRHKKTVFNPYPVGVTIIMEDPYLKSKTIVFLDQTAYIVFSLHQTLAGIVVSK